MKKALQLVPAMDEGGVERYAVTLNRILVGAGWENVVVSKGGKLVAEVERDGGRHVTLDLKSKNPLTALVRAVKLRRLLKREKPDVVCAHSRVPAWLFVLASRGLGLRWMTFAHGVNSVSRYSRVMTRGDRVMCPSSFVADYLKANYDFEAAKLRVVPHAVDVARFDPAKLDRVFVEAKRREWGLDGRFVVMSVGRLTPLKGFDLLIRAVAEISEPDVKLVIVGGAAPDKAVYLAELKRLAAELGMGERVVFAGAQAQVAECLSLADVVVSANFTKPEAFGLSMVEALTMGRPVVAKAFGGALDIVRDGRDGVLVRDDPDAPIEALFSAAIDRVRRHPFSADTLRREALARFAFANMAERTRAVYDELA